MSLKLKVVADDDQEIRQYIKDLIKGVIVQIARAEIEVLVKEELERKIKPLEQTKNITNIIDDIITRHINKILGKYWESDNYIKRRTNRLIKEYMEKITFNYDLLIKSVLRKYLKDKGIDPEGLI